MQSSGPRPGSSLLRACAVAVTYYALARLGFYFGALPGHVAPVWPPAGFGLAAVMLWGRRVTPGIFLGAFIAHLPGLPVGSVFVIASASTIEAVVGACLLEKAGVRGSLARPRDVAALIVLAACVASLLGAALGNAALNLGGIFPREQLWEHLRIWWAGDAVGMLTFAPFVLAWREEDPPPSNGTRAEMVAIVATTAALALGALQTKHSSAFFVYPIVAWAALRFGRRGATSVTLVVVLFSVIRTGHFNGPFATGHVITDLWLLDSLLAVLSAQGLLLAAVVGERDRSQRQLTAANAELEGRVAERTQELRFDRARLEVAQSIGHIGSWEWDACADVMTCTAEMHRIYGFDQHMAPGPIDTWVGRVHLDDLDLALEVVMEASANGGEFAFEHRIIRTDGELRWVRIQGHSDVLRGVLTRMNGIAQDITEAKRADEVIRATEVRTTRIVEAANEAFVSMDGSQHITGWNRQAELTFGWSRDEVLGQRLSDIIVPACLRAQHDEGVARFLKTGQIQVLNTRREVTALHRDGHEFAIELAIWWTEGVRGETSFHAFMHDISERQAHKAQLAAALEEAREASRSKSAFVANMSHEIRTPMNGVLGMIGLLLDTQLDGQQLDYVQTMTMSAEALLAIIDDILDVTKIEAGKLTIDKGDFALRRLVQDTITPFMPAVADKGIELNAYVAHDVPDAINGDRLRLRQVVSNLVSNAVKFTTCGVVELRITCDRARLQFEVVDTGVGIPDNAESYLFDPFVQGDASTTRCYGGTGLGLAICRQLVTLMGGEIGAEPRNQGGSRFWFTLPLVPARGLVQSAEQRRVAPSPEKDALGRRVLVVEDNPVNRKVAVGMLEQLGYAVEIAGDGVDAVELFIPGAYDAVLMDCQMPRMDGYDATVAIRALEPGRHTPIIAMTASAMASDRERCLAVGMDEYLSKPINRDLLATILHECTKGRPNAMTTIPTPPSSEEAFDAETLEQLRSLDTDGSFIAELVGMFRDDIAGHVATLHKAIAARDEDTIARTAHQAKGASANLGMRALAASLKNLELAATASDDELTNAMHLVEAKVAEALAFADTLVAA